MTDPAQPLEQRVVATLRTKIEQLPPVTLTLDRDAAPMSPVEPPRSSRSRLLVAAAVALVVLLVAGALAVIVRGENRETRHPAGPATEPVVARLQLEALSTLSLQSKEFTTIAGINQITLVGNGGSESLVFDDPSLAAFHVSYPNGPSVGTVNLEAGRDYLIHSVIPGHTAAGVEATIHVLPAGAAGTPPVPEAVLGLVSATAQASGGRARGEADYTVAGRNAANVALLDAEIPRDEQPVYVFVLRGSFVNDHGTIDRPAGSPPRRASVMTLTITQGASPEVLDFGLGSTLPALSELGGAITTEYSPATPTKGTMPAARPDGSVDPAEVPDFVATLDRSGNIVGYVKSEKLLNRSPESERLTVYGDDLETIVGHQYPGRGFVPVGQDPATVPLFPSSTTTTTPG